MLGMYVSIDIGGSNARVAFSESLARVEINPAHVYKFSLSHDYDTDLAEIVDAIVGKNAKVDAIGIGIAGDVISGEKMVLSATHIHEWERKPFVKLLAEKFNCPVEVSNDAVTAALGEAKYGAGRGKDFVYVTWGTGIGGAVVSNNAGNLEAKKLHWRKYFAEFEELCGGKCLEKRFNKPAGQLTEAEWDLVMADFKINLLELAHRLQKNQFVLGGGAADKQQKRLQSMTEELKQNKVELLLASLGDNSGLYGGFALFA